MAPKAKAATKPAEVPAKGAEKSKVKKKGKPRNYDLGNGVYRFSRTRMYHKKAIYKFLKKKAKPVKKEKKPLTVVKQLGGEKNGEKRIVLIKKRKNSYPTQDKYVFFVFVKRY